MQNPHTSPSRLASGTPQREHSFVNRAQASEGCGSLTGVLFAPRSSALAAEIDRAAAAAPAGAEQVTVELAVSPDGWAAPNPRRARDSTPYVGITMTLQSVDPLESLRKLLQEGWTLTTIHQTEGKQ